MYLPDLSKQLLLQVKLQQPIAHLQQLLRQLPFSQLRDQLQSDVQKTAFWLNIYNAFMQWRLQHDAAAWNKKQTLFSDPWITIAGWKISPDTIEHGILRRSRWKYGLGYIPQWPVPAREKQVRVVQPDYRLHFALNCGAASCPAIACYDPTQLAAQLQVASNHFLKNNSAFDAPNRVLHISRIFLWFWGDFGSASGIRALHQQAGIVPAGIKVRLRFSGYDWSPAAASYID